MLSRENKRLLVLGHFFLWHTWRCLLRSLWLFFPSIIFLFAAYFAFWQITQGRDLMVITLEEPEKTKSLYEFSSFVVALIFWVYVTWYSTRIIARAKQFQDPDDDPVWEIFRIQIPRILAFTCLSIILIAFLRLEYYSHIHLKEWQWHVMLLLSYGEFTLIYHFWTWFLQKKERTSEGWVKFLKRVRMVAHTVLLIAISVVIKIHTYWWVIGLLLVLQLALVLLLIVRRELDVAESIRVPENKQHVTRHSSLIRRLQYIIVHDENPNYVRFFLVISAIGIFFYTTAIIDIRFAVFIGSFPFMLLAFGVLLGFGNMLTYLSVLIRFNCHLLLFAISLIFGAFWDSHQLKLPAKTADAPRFDDRQNLKQYFNNWLNDPIRKDLLADTSNSTYPVYFVMANGGASRSGYWTANILCGLQDSSGGKFADHLFCLSGASGGSVGTGTFFSLLRAKDSLQKKGITFDSAAKQYLGSDFLTFTVSHLLGPDIFRNFLPFLNGMEMDRGHALARSLEKAPERDAFLYDSFAVRFSDIITQNDSSIYRLPILCINTTRMQDGRPAVISNIRIKADSAQNNYFNDRLDVLSMLGEKRDMRLSTAVVLGASFPYISPAGRIDEAGTGADSNTWHSQYFVDGGYFDNSGAGVVNEMIIAMRNLMETDTAFMRYRNKIEFHVIHISNTDPKEMQKEPINSMTNDLLAPAKTLLGSYGTQTTVNDQRLKSYLYALYKDTTHYNKIDLYENKGKEDEFSMNWVISNVQRTQMNNTLLANASFLRESRYMTKISPDHSASALLELNKRISTTLFGKPSKFK